MKRDVFQAIADPTRRAILVLMAAQAMTPNEVAGHFDSTRQAVSKHIRILAESGLLEQKRSGREIVYRFRPEKLKKVDSWLEQFKGQMETRFRQLDQLLNDKTT